MKRILYLVLAIQILSSCKKYLDIVPDNVATLDYAFRNRNEAENYLFTCYNTYQGLQALESNAGWTSSGELVLKTDLKGVNFASNYNPNGFWVMYGYLSPYGTGATTNIQNWFSNLYTAIRRCNTFLDNVNKPVDLSSGEKARWVAEAKILKAWYYYYLVRQYGPVPLVKDNLPVFTETATAKIPRSPSDEVFRYIYDLADEALADLPDMIYDLQNETGRFTQVMALSLKAKAAVLQASPLFNGDPDFSALANKDGTRLFPQAYDAAKWDTAARFCRAALDLCEQQSITLFRYNQATNTQNPIPDSLQLLLSIQGPINFDRSTSFSIPEVIWPGNVRSRQQRYFAPNIVAAKITTSMDYDASLSVPLKIAELFYTNNGVPIDEDKNYNYSGRYGYSLGTADQRFYTKQGYATANLNQYREPRYYADLSFDGGIWYGFGFLSASNLLNNDAVPTQHSSYTGYWPKKLVNYQTRLSSSVTDEAGYYPPMMRLADLQLLYAEALNESKGPGAEVYRYIDSVRIRAGLKGVLESWQNFSTQPNKPATKDGLRSIIHQERRIELCFEGEVGWDLRRWKEYLQANSGPCQGWSNIGTTTAADYYKIINKFVPSLAAKNYFWPLHESLLLNNEYLVQNLYW
ncbi:RagB/SusD family nutrient uptake outer membrane protein [Niabella hirudinis]|uniref:RagB/SusD family nutrient uptake outer membrane protein n=1 Tax=Niabella hirudinis TaxID=1285929 RepID=UPI003EBE1F08